MAIFLCDLILDTGQQTLEFALHPAIMIPTIASLPAQPTVLENVTFVVTGFLFVLCVLTFLSIVTSFVGVICSRLIKEPTPASEKELKPEAIKSTVSPEPQKESTEDEEIPERILALIGIAAHVMLEGRPQKIVSIRGTSQGWAREGRREIFSSHRVR